MPTVCHAHGQPRPGLGRAPGFPRRPGQCAGRADAREFKATLHLTVGLPGRRRRPLLASWSGALWCDVLVQAEEVAGVVGPLDLNQAVIVLTVVVLNLVIIVVVHEVDIAAGF